jgi:hypothetical protein
MTAKTRRLLAVLVLSSGLGVAAVAIMIYATWPDNTLGIYLHVRRNREANVRALEARIAAETDPGWRAFYQAWLAEEKGDLDDAIRGFSVLREKAPLGTPLHLNSSLRLGLAYGRNGNPERELAIYQGLMERYPGPSRLSQATFHLRRHEAARARTMLDEALAQDARDGSLGPQRQFAQGLRDGLEPGQSGGPPASR